MEDQKSHDRRIQSVKRNNIRNNRRDEIRKIKCVRNIIQDLERHGPAGLIHIAHLSDIIGRPIRIWNSNGCLISSIGKGEIEKSIDIEYHVKQSESIGHWTLRKNKDPINAKIDLNSCLFSVIGSQTGYNPLRLRSWTVLILKSNPEKLINQINDIINDRNSLMIGGARYIGISAADARIILDNSQNQRCHECNTVGHPRGHAIGLETTGQYDSVQMYSKTNGSRKTAFLSRDDQDMMAHLVLRTTKAQETMADMNRRLSQANLNISPSEITRIENVRELPRMCEYYAGELIQTNRPINRMVMLLRHKVGEFLNEDADVFVYTFYPKL